MINPDTARRWFHRVTWVGIFANLALALPTIAAPTFMIDTVSLPTATPDLWPRFAGLLLLILSVFYMPAATDIDRYRVVGWFAVGSRLTGFLFFLIEGAPYLMFGLFDLVFFIPQAALLTIIERGPKPSVAKAEARLV
jgi:hypothetical protein